MCKNENKAISLGNSHTVIKKIIIPFQLQKKNDLEAIIKINPQLQEKTAELINTKQCFWTSGVTKRLIAWFLILSGHGIYTYHANSIDYYN